MTCCSRSIVKEIKIIGKIENVAARNGVNYTDGFLEFGGPLIHDTVVNGNYKLSFGNFGSSINYFSVSSSTTVYLEASNGISGSFINIDNNVILLGSSSPTSKGLQGLHDYSPNYTALTYVQKIYTDSRIVGFPVSTDIYTPGPPQNGQVIAWNDPSRMWVMQAAGAAPTAGSDTQVIFNQAGTLVGHNNFTFVPSTNTLSVPTIELGNSILTGTQRVIIARTNDAYADIIIEPKGAGSVHAYLTTGALIIGSNTSSSTYQRLQARGAGAQVDIALEPKGTDGMVFIGDKDEAGAFRKLAARGYNADLHLMLQSKGQGNVILDPDPNNSLDGAWVKIGQGSGTIPGTRTRRLYADSEYATTNLEIGGGGNQNFVLLIGTSNQNVSTRLLTVGSSATDCNLNIYGKGAGLVAVNGIVRSKKIAFYWNMDNTGGITIAHGFDVNSWKKIVSVDVVVRNNFDAEYGPLDRKVGADTTGASQGGIVSWGNTTVALTRRDGGFFDNANYNLFSPYVRGWIYINYEL
jgi:hypothetical protein